MTVTIWVLILIAYCLILLGVFIAFFYRFWWNHCHFFDQHTSFNRFFCVGSLLLLHCDIVAVEAFLFQGSLHTRNRASPSAQLSEVHESRPVQRVTILVVNFSEYLAQIALQSSLLFSARKLKVVIGERCFAACFICDIMASSHSCIHDNVGPGPAGLLPTTPRGQQHSALAPRLASAAFTPAPVHFTATRSADGHESPCSPTPSPSPPLHHKLIRQEDITMEENRLGQGGFGFVHRGTYKGLAVVLKYFHSRSSDAAIRETYNRELKALELDLKHENIVTILGATSTFGWREGACIVMEDAGGESLQAYLEDKSRLMTLHHSLFFLCHVLDGVGYLHSRNVVHLDLKPANFILSPADRSGCPVIRLCDFGTIHLVGQPWKSQLEGTVAFRAPELFCGGTPAFSSDVYSLGLVMWCFDTRSFPFLGKSREQIIYRCVQDHLRPLVPSGGRPLRQAYRNLYQRCWAPSACERPGLQEVTDIIQELSDDVIELKSVPLMSPSSLPPAQHSAPGCVKCHPAADLPRAPSDKPSPTNCTGSSILPGQRNNLPQPSAVDVSRSAPTCPDVCQWSVTPPNLCNSVPVFMGCAPVAADVVARLAVSDHSPSSLPPRCLSPTHNDHQLSPTPPNLCDSMPDIQGLSSATSCSLLEPCAMHVSDSATTSAHDNCQSPPTPPNLCKSTTVPAHEESTLVNPVTSNKSLLSLSSHHFSTLHHKHIRQEDIAQEESIGRGGFGSVYRGTYRGTAVACKSFHSHTDDAIVRETYDRELKALELDLKHDNIVTLLGATSTLGWEEGACIVMEYAGGVSLQSYLKDESKHIPFEHSLFFLCDILQGVSYLHSRNVIHLDLKPANFILSVGPVVRICDFGTVHVVGQPWQSQIAGTVAFRAPELFIGGNPTFASDIYSLGFVMWCFDTRLFPFAGESRDYIISLCVDQLRRPAVPLDGNPLLQRFRTLYQKCWASLRGERPTLEEIIMVIEEISDFLVGLE